MTIIGIGYQKGVGKDLLATQLMQDQAFVHRFNPVRIGFADALKQEFAGMFDTTVEEIDANKTLWRPGLQWYGTEYMQQIKNDKTYWVRRIGDRIPYLLRMGHKALIIPDVRFLHETEFILSHGGRLVRVLRGNGGRSDKHRSEQELAEFTGWTHTVLNDGTVDQLRRKAFELTSELLGDSFSTTQPATVGI